MGKPVRIIAASDNHGDRDILESIKKKYPDCDYYFHLGDSEMDPEELKGWICVQGNNDYFSRSIPLERVVEAAGHRILLVHGHHDAVWQNDLSDLQKHAEKENCDIVFFGHTHTYLDKKGKNARMLNPGSTSRPRSFHEGGSCMYVILEDRRIEVNRINLDEDSPEEDYASKVIRWWKRRKRQQ